jgi:acyl-CoA thioester hydrolase
MNNSPVHTAEPFTFTVHIFDTDCYGVVWHGAYTKWLEMARVALCEQLGIPMQKPDVDATAWLFPVTDQVFRFVTPATLDDALAINTTLEVKGVRLVFSQVITQQATEAIVLNVTTTCVVVDENWQLQRRLPADLAHKLTPTV